MIAQFSVFLTLAAAAQCPVNESADADKYPCKYSFANDAVSLYIGSHAGNVYMKATTNDKRWVVVGPSLAHMRNLHVVINHKEASAEGQGGEQSIPEAKATGWSKPEKTAFQEEPVLSLEGESRTTELVFDAGKWETDFESGVSIAWGEDESKRTVEHHCKECKKFITFNGDDDQYKLPVVSASVGAMGVIYLGFLLL